MYIKFGCINFLKPQVYIKNNRSIPCNICQVEIPLHWWEGYIECKINAFYFTKIKNIIIIKLNNY